MARESLLRLPLLRQLLFRIVIWKSIVSAHVCYQDRDSRLGTLRGQWTYQNESRVKSKIKSSSIEYNGRLGCPFELKKWACLDKNISSGEVGINLQFTPSDCELRNIQSFPNFFSELLKNRRILFFGDSLLRQVFVSLSCQAFSVIDLGNSTIDWYPTCPNKICQDAPDAIITGANLKLVNGGHVLFVDISNSLHFLTTYVRSESQNGDVIVVEVGAHGLNIGSILEEIKPLFSNHKQPSDHQIDLIWMETPTPNFVTESGGFPQPPNKLTSLNCVKPIHPMLSEMKRMYNAHLIDKTTSPLAGILSIEGWGTGQLWEAKIGNGDCQHFCLPGPPDFMASALLTMMEQI